MDREMLVERLEAGMSLAAIGREVGCHESTVASWLRWHRLAAVNRERHAAGVGCSGSCSERLVGQGLSIAQIASEVDRSKATVRHSLKRYGLKTLNPRKAPRGPDSALAHAADLSEATMTCPRHGATMFVVDGRG